MENVKVRYWFLFMSSITTDGPPTEIVIDYAPLLIASFGAENLKGTYHMPVAWMKDDGSRASYMELKPNTKIEIGNLKMITGKGRVGIGTWGIYLYGDKTDVTFLGPTSICEFMLWNGKATLKGTNGYKNLYASATTIEVGELSFDSSASKNEAAKQHFVAELTIDNAKIGGAKGGAIRGQITAQNGGKVNIIDSQCTDLALITKGNGTINVKNLSHDGEITKMADGGPIDIN